MGAGRARLGGSCPGEGAGDGGGRDRAVGGGAETKSEGRTDKSHWLGRRGQ